MEFKDPSSFTFTQLLQEPEGAIAGSGNTPVGTHGEIHIKLASGPSKSIWIDSETHHHKQLWVNTAVDKDAITLTSPPSTSGNDVPYCVHIKTTIWIPKGLDLSSFNIHTDSLSVIFADNISFTPHTPISISAPAGSVNLHSTHQTLSSLSISALETTLRSSSGSVKGHFTLRDSLTIHTSSGSIEIDLALASTPQNATGPATLDLKTTSGSIRVATTTIATPDEIPKNKDYRSVLRTNSGSISATLVHGSATDLHSDSSSVRASLFPHGDLDKRSDITTKGLSGSTDIVLYPSLTSPTEPMRNLYASYTGVSGSVRVQYPVQWEGKVEGSTVSGHIGVAWPGLKIVEDSNGWGSHRLKAVKGDGNGVLKFKGVSGSVELRGGASPRVPVVVAESDKANRMKEEGGKDEQADEKTLVRDRVSAVVDDEKEEDTETEVGSQVVLTPTSEVEGDEWKLFQ
ncbi:MAG: hypothetical protein LQ350_001370 [Teloschistes chrysophthalmus]|nr:MAG: hypothetical protein LQ350_001370 [Niorma chrysophthalma]